MRSAAVQSTVDRGLHFAGVPLDRPRIMGILNITPDSFSDGGEVFEADNAVRRAHQMIEDGTDILDVGGESTRPGSAPVTVSDEIARVVPVIQKIRDLGVPISIDTRNAETMKAALEAGATIINDVSGLTHDADALTVAAEAQCPVVLMHMIGTPETMQRDPHYDDVVTVVRDHLLALAARCVDVGISPDQIALDPGIGFGKTVDHNASLIAGLGSLANHGHPILVGVSRKAFISKLSKGEDAQHRVPGSLAAALAGVAQGAKILRVHDVAETSQALAVWGAIHKG